MIKSNKRHTIKKGKNLLCIIDNDAEHIVQGFKTLLEDSGKMCLNAKLFETENKKEVLNP